MKLAVVDGQGGGIGRTIIEKIKKNLSSDIEIIALGTNAMATTTMMKAGAAKGATGENPIVVMANKVDVIVGPLAIINANSMLGEISEKMAVAISTSDAMKFLIPLEKCKVHICGLSDTKLDKVFDDMLSSIRDYQRIYQL